MPHAVLEHPTNEAPQPNTEAYSVPVVAGKGNITDWVRTAPDTTTAVVDSRPFGEVYDTQLKPEDGMVRGEDGMLRSVHAPELARRPKTPVSSVPQEAPRIRSVFDGAEQVPATSNSPYDEVTGAHEHGASNTPDAFDEPTGQQGEMPQHDLSDINTPTDQRYDLSAVATGLHTVITAQQPQGTVYRGAPVEASGTVYGTPAEQQFQPAQQSELEQQEYAGRHRAQ